MTPISSYCFRAARSCPATRRRSPRSVTYCGNGIASTARCASAIAERVTDHAVAARRRRGERACTQTVGERGPEPMSRELKGPESADGEQIVRCQPQCTPQDSVRLRVVRRITDLSRTLLVRKREQV